VGDRVDPFDGEVSDAKGIDSKLLHHLIDRAVF